MRQSASTAEREGPVRRDRNHGPRWLLSRVPQFAQMPDEVRRRLWRQCKRQANKHWQVWMGYLLVSSPCLVVIALTMSDLPRAIAFLNQYLPLIVVGFAIYGTAALVLLPMVERPFFIQHLRQEIGGLCLKCGYDLRATPDRCPECGRPVEHPRAISKEHH